MAESLVFLIGYRGSGKSTVAQHLAQRLGYVCHDSDRLVESATGKSIAQIFTGEGEHVFRDHETAVVRELCTRRGAVVSLGGGAVLREENRQRIGAAGTVVWLTASVDTLLGRLESDPSSPHSRPSLTGAGGRDEILAVLTERTPIYRECANLVVDTEGKTPPQIAEEIAQQLPSTRHAAQPPATSQ